jgi:hypothetical protein
MVWCNDLMPGNGNSVKKLQYFFQKKTLVYLFTSQIILFKDKLSNQKISDIYNDDIAKKTWEIWRLTFLDSNHTSIERAITELYERQRISKRASGKQSRQLSSW